ncbi:hypothetical protein [Caldalkalibacillus mannanilyticus]|nr:hypothetical protein [Caldalkalibacillus mannanilyticus]
MQSLIQTYAQIEGVEEIQLTIDGQIQETLAGHVSIDKPFTKDEIIYQNQ